MASLKGNISTSNETSADNPLVSSRYSRPSNAYSGPSITNKNTAPNPGGLIKSNVMSADNPFAGYRQYDNVNGSQHAEPWRKINTYARPQSGNHFPPNVPDERLPHHQMRDGDSTRNSGTYLPPIDGSSSGQPKYYESGLYYPSSTNLDPNVRPVYDYNQEPVLTNYQPLMSGDTRSSYNNFNSVSYASSSPQVATQLEKLAANNSKSNTSSLQAATTLEKQAAERDLNRFLDEKNRKINDPNCYHQGSIAENSYQPFVANKFVNPASHQAANTTYNSSYQATSPSTLPRLNKDVIVEKPNSLSADLAPYDPIKDPISGNTTLPQGYNYDPWGKPGSGAPLIDPNTGRKFTKMSGQVWYDTIGMSPDERARIVLDRNRPLTLEEQKYEMEMERERRRFEDASYRARAGDVATWITDIENRRARQNGAHLPHTNVTREKINLEYARRGTKDEATKAYHDELQMQLEERERENRFYKMQDELASIEHVKRWDDWWGRPGGGAPNLERRRHNIEEKLEQTTNQNGTSLPVGANRFNNNTNVIYSNTSSSSHKNLYDNLMPMK